MYKIPLDLSDDFAEKSSPIVDFLLRADISDLSPKRLLNQNETDMEIATARLAKIVEWREMLAQKFGADDAARRLCVLSLGRLISKKFAGKSQGYNATGYTLQKLANAMAEKKPVIFTFCFGGYKSPTSPDYPEPGYAELYHLNYLAQYLLPIIRNYKYGVELEFDSEEISVAYNNMPQSALDKYDAAFRKLLDWTHERLKAEYKIDLPMRLVLARKQYPSEQALHDLIMEKLPDYERLFDELDKDTQEKWLQRAATNIVWDGAKDLTALSPAEKAAAVKMTRLYNEAFLEADYILRQDFFEAPNRIPLTGTWGIMPSASPTDGWLHLKSTRASMADSWTGYGMVQNIGGEMVETILSRTQLDAASDKIRYVENTDATLRAISKNFDKIAVID
ncbi:MAG: hypothetical protein FWD15_05395 [Alphaproteobacteria bacterium]|nr:hypothetical protein [Alphaproteobacteria bacterium]